MTATRFAALAAIAFAILFVVGLLVMGDTPSGDDPNDVVARYWDDSGHQAQALITAYLLSLAAVALVAFATAAFRPDPDTPLSRIARTSAVLAGAAFGVGGIAIGSVAGAAAFDSATITAEGSSLLLSLGFGTITVFGAIAAAAMIAAISAEWLRTRAVPMWLCWLGFLCAVVVLFGIVFIPLVALPIWAVAVGVVFMMGRAPVLAPPGQTRMGPAEH